ncbi:glycosyltransferase [Cellulophaga sp. E16_2]|uniref:glycosyltransferase n=1 Tax=Cellulophaga sp. E16_2 TaxID=2789297 RepID=UPI001A921A38|nr:glycosyltransferase [Cellulophaga sp. E16_2]MBO0590868.1 glycosyltransferase [Cellulophaga sp. E16_2]
MKVLIFTNSSAKYDAAVNSYHGAGWVESFITLLEDQKEIELAVSFFHEKDRNKITRDNLTFYPIFKASRRSNPIKTILGDWRGSIENEKTCKDMLTVIEDFKPDVIQVFGSENMYALIQKYTKVPVVVHLQGLLNPYYNAFYPINQSKYNFIFDLNYLKSNILGKGINHLAKRIKNKAIRETNHFKNLHYVMGRTHWDKMVTKIHNPEITYFHADEVLRPIFYDSVTKVNNRKRNIEIQLITTISPTLYKGLDVILKTANLLREATSLHFSWSIIGLEQTDPLVYHFEKSLKLKHQNLNINFLGIRQANDFVNSIQQADLFIHPSYIDNSPNSVCEAQIMGVPVIACNVGGLSSLITDNVTGRLVPSNGIYELVDCILEFNENSRKYWTMADKAQVVAKQRHNQQRIVQQVLETYQTIINA